MRRRSFDNRVDCLVRVMALCSMTLAVAVSAFADEWRSTDGLYRLSVDSELEPLTINRLHRWTLRLQDENGVAVADADIKVSGGMPGHNHGLPTSPRVTRELGDGRYLLEGMRFHMPGRWEVTVRIDAGPGADTVVIVLEL